MGQRQLSGQTQRNVRANNLHAIITLFRERGTLTIRDITDQTGLSKTAVAKILNELVHRGLIRSMGKGSSTISGGKRPDLFVFSAQNCYALSCIFSLTNITAILYDAELKCLDSTFLFFTESDAPAYPQAVSVLADQIKNLLSRNKIDPKHLVGISVATVGVVDITAGAIVSPVTNRHWGTDLPFVADLQAALPFPCRIFLDNAVRFAAYYLLEEDPRRWNRNIVMLYCENSVGGAYLRNGHLVHGKHGFVGEFGHITTDFTFKERCKCGRYGCFESIIARDQVQSRVQREIVNWPESVLNACPCFPEIPISYLFQAADGGDMFAQRQVDLLAQQFASMVYNFQIMYDPDEVVIYTYYVKSTEYFQKAFAARLTPFMNNDQLKLTLKPLNYSPLQLTTVHTGGAAFAFDQYFNGSDVTGLPTPGV